MYVDPIGFSMLHGFWGVILVVSCRLVVEFRLLMLFAGWGGCTGVVSGVISGGLCVVSDIVSRFLVSGGLYQW